MAVQKRKPKFCVPTVSDGCAPKPPSPQAKAAVDSHKVYQLLKKQRAICSKDDQKRFVEFLDQSIRHRNAAKQRWSKNKLKADDIIRLIIEVRDEGDLDEAIWRSFLAAHLGRTSANGSIENQIESAAMLLCGFGSTPKWTWSKVVAQPKSFRNWLYDHEDDLEVLSFGNHRKYESKKPDLLWEVIESFLDLVSEYRGPAALFSLDGDSDGDFDVLYKRLAPLHRFGRTGKFDFMELLSMLGLILAEPTFCYLRGATGPLSGAKRLWGKRKIGELEALAVEVADRLGISPALVEDALCNWQK